MGSLSCPAVSGKTLCFPISVDFQYWLVTAGLGAGMQGRQAVSQQMWTDRDCTRGCCLGRVKH